MRPVVLALLTFVAACEPVEPRGGSLPPQEPPPKPDPVEAVEVSAPPVAAAPAEPAEAEPAEAEPEAAPPAEEMTDEELLAAAMGLPLPPKKEEAPLPVAGAPAVAPWTPAAPAPTWGVRVVSIVADAQPPRAILGLGDGREIVVEPGTFVPEERVIVMAIGAEAVQIAHVEPAGDRSRIDTQVLTPMYRPQPPR